MKSDAKLSFDKHMEQIYAKVRAKLKVLARIASFMNIQKKKVLMKALICMFHSRKLDSKINKLHERCIGIVCMDNT